MKNIMIKVFKIKLDRVWLIIQYIYLITLS